MSVLWLSVFGALAWCALSVVATFALRPILRAVDYPLRPRDSGDTADAGRAAAQVADPHPTLAATRR